jgi:hypothetical protein
MTEMRIAKNAGSDLVKLQLWLANSFVLHRTLLQCPNFIY